MENMDKAYQMAIDKYQTDPRCTSQYLCDIYMKVARLL